MLTLSAHTLIFAHSCCSHAFLALKKFLFDKTKKICIKYDALWRVPRKKIFGAVRLSKINFYLFQLYIII